MPRSGTQSTVSRADHTPALRLLPRDTAARSETRAPWQDSNEGSTAEAHGSRLLPICDVAGLQRVTNSTALLHFTHPHSPCAGFLDHQVRAPVTCQTARHTPLRSP